MESSQPKPTSLSISTRAVGGRRALEELSKKFGVSEATVACFVRSLPEFDAAAAPLIEVVRTSPTILVCILYWCATIFSAYIYRFCARDTPNRELRTAIDAVSRMMQNPENAEKLAQAEVDAEVGAAIERIFAGDSAANRKLITDAILQLRANPASASGGSGEPAASPASGGSGEPAASPASGESGEPAASPAPAPEEPFNLTSLRVQDGAQRRDIAAMVERLNAHLSMPMGESPGTLSLSLAKSPPGVAEWNKFIDLLDSYSELLLAQTEVQEAEEAVAQKGEAIRTAENSLSEARESAIAAAASVTTARTLLTEAKNEFRRVRQTEAYKVTWRQDVMADLTAVDPNLQGAESLLEVASLEHLRSDTGLQKACSYIDTLFRVIFKDFTITPHQLAIRAYAIYAGDRFADFLASRAERISIGDDIRLPEFDKCTYGDFLKCVFGTAGLERCDTLISNYIVTNERKTLRDAKITQEQFLAIQDAMRIIRLKIKSIAEEKELYAGKTFADFVRTSSRAHSAERKDAALAEPRARLVEAEAAQRAADTALTTAAEAATAARRAFSAAEERLADVRTELALQQKRWAKQPGEGPENVMEWVVFQTRFLLEEFPEPREAPPGVLTRDPGEFLARKLSEVALFNRGTLRFDPNAKDPVGELNEKLGLTGNERFLSAISPRIMEKHMGKFSALLTGLNDCIWLWRKEYELGNVLEDAITGTARDVQVTFIRTNKDDLPTHLRASGVRVDNVGGTTGRLATLVALRDSVEMTENAFAMAKFNCCKRPLCSAPTITYGKRLFLPEYREGLLLRECLAALGENFWVTADNPDCTVTPEQYAELQLIRSELESLSDSVLQSVSSAQIEVIQKKDGKLKQMPVGEALREMRSGRAFDVDRARGDKMKSLWGELELIKEEIREHQRAFRQTSVR
ncbi:MAG: hypothetical protein LBF24_01825 [Puniceicoccales bacterium]|jgi:hypothetical protein|nr:hypothetical protein [Puniceicoccales bacterium]